LKIVITGAMGHIGSYLIRNLGVQFPNAEIIMIDNLMTQRFTSLFNLPKTAIYRFIEGDITQLDLKSIFKGVDVVIHLAAITDAAASFGNAVKVENNNYLSTVQVADACAETNSALIAISSTSVYGTQNLEVDEDCSEDELKPQSPYAKTKIREEEYISNLKHSKGLRSIHCRFGTIYGVSPGMRFHTAVNKFCWQAVMGQPISVWTTAYDQYRPYLDLLDASEAIVFIIKNNLFDGQIYNILTDNFTVRKVVNTIQEQVPSLEIDFVNNQIMNQLSYKVLCDRFKSKGFVFSGNLNRGIKDTINLLHTANKI
jgi:UDP-glucose 4-epimerase